MRLTGSTRVLHGHPKRCNDPTGKGGTWAPSQRGQVLRARASSAASTRAASSRSRSGKEIVVGRSSDLDMVLVEDMVARKHARINLQPDGIWIEDLGSTNGTFVNGEKIKRARLKEGDRVLIGTSILKVIAGDGSPESTHRRRQARSRERGAAAPHRQARTMSGAIEEIPLPGPAPAPSARRRRTASSSSARTTTSARSSCARATSTTR